MKKPTGSEVLECPMDWPYGKDTDADTVEDYLINLLFEVTKWQDGFDGKRPFGNSGWLYNDIGRSLAVAGIIDSRSNHYGDLEFDYSDVDEAVYEAISAIKESLWVLRDLSR